MEWTDGWNVLAKVQWMITDFEAPQSKIKGEGTLSVL